MLVDARARTLTSAAEVFRNYRETRARLTAPPPAPPAPPPPVESEKPKKMIPGPDFVALVDAVAERAGVTRDRLLSEAEFGPVIEARKIAMALSFLRLRFSHDDVARIFGVLPQSSKLAVREALPIYTGGAIPATATVQSVVAVLFDRWRRDVGMPTGATVDAIKLAVCKAWGARPVDVESERRTLDVIVPRQVGMALARRLTLRSLPYIGRRFGNRDHTTVMHAVRKMAPVLDRAAATLSAEATTEQWIAAVIEALKA